MLPYSYASGICLNSYSHTSSLTFPKSLILTQLSNSELYFSQWARYSVVMSLSLWYILLNSSFSTFYFFLLFTITSSGSSGLGHQYGSLVWAGSRCATDITSWMCQFDDNSSQYASFSTQFRTFSRLTNCCLSFLFFSFRLSSI